mgnify:CR=1 FL=1
MSGSKQLAAEQSATSELSANASNPMQPRHVETVIIGSGFSGLLAAIRLQKRRCNDFVLLERNAELGGTWQVNSYPGAEVDIPTSLYCISFIPYPFGKTEILQMAMLKPEIAIMDETDSGLDIDALRIVSEGVNTLAGPDLGVLVITHYQRILDYIKPHFVHVMLDGRVTLSGGPELALELESRGYDFVREGKEAATR